MAHNRKYVPGMIDLVKGRVRNDMPIMKNNQNDIELLIISSQILNSAPFKWVGLMYRYGIKNDLNVEYDRIDKKDGELPIAIELRMDILQWADRNNLDLMYEIFMIGALEAMIHVCQKYKLDDAAFKEERIKFGTIPESIEECEEKYSKE